jgi:hypothetical protein
MEKEKEIIEALTVRAAIEDKEALEAAFNSIVDIENSFSSGPYTALENLAYRLSVKAAVEYKEENKISFNLTKAIEAFNTLNNNAVKFLTNLYAFKVRLEEIEKEEKRLKEIEKINKLITIKGVVKPPIPA